MSIHSVRQPDGRFANAEKPAAKRIEVWLDEASLKRIDVAAKEAGVGRGKAIADLISTADPQWSVTAGGQSAPTPSGGLPAVSSGIPTPSGPSPTTGGGDVIDACIWRTLGMGFAIGAQILQEVVDELQLGSGAPFMCPDEVRHNVLEKLAADMPELVPATANLSNLEALWFSLMVERLRLGAETWEKQQAS